jgi:CRISPR-associated helicase Cas3/CRISPR-associated HD domain protein
MDNLENLLKEHLKKHFAKSDEETTLEKHINDLLDQFRIFLNRYPNVLNEREKMLLEKAIEYHDYGKLNKLFQDKLRSYNRHDDIVPHQFLSPLFLISRENKLDDKDLLIIVYSIVNHHQRGQDKYLKYKDRGVNVLFNEIERHFPMFFQHIGFKGLSKDTKERYKGFLIKIAENIKPIENLNKMLYEGDYEGDIDIKTLIKVSGLLIRIDHAASGYGMEIEEPCLEGDREEIFLNYLKKLKNDDNVSLKGFQQRFKDCENTVLVADTGLGKTGLAFLWSKRKMFYVLPNRTSTNAMYETYKQIAGENRVGLLHSTSMFYIYEKNEEDGDYTILRDHDNTKNLSKPITICTADQLFEAVFKYPTYERIYATLSYSDVVIDEIQGFDPAQIVPIIKQIEETTKLGTRYLIMTATLPGIVKEKFEKLGFNVIVDDPDTIDKTKRHKVCFVEKSILSDIESIVKKAKENKHVLVILNTVSEAQNIYKKLRESYENVKLLHSRFIWKDRIEKEREIQKDYKHSEGVIWVTTQLVEASLDIDFDVLFTEVAPADSLIQRMGRVHRHKKHDYLGDYNVYIYTEVDEKKTSRIYEKVLRDKSIELIKENLDKESYLSSYSKRKIVETLYSEEFLKRINSKYIEKWKEVEEILNSKWEGVFKTAQETFRDIFTVEVVPYMFKEIVQRLEEDYCNAKEINNKQEREIKRMSILKKINDYKVPIPLYWWLSQNKSKFEYYSRLGIKILGKEFEYDSDLGIIIKEETLQNSYVDEDIFI